MIQQSIDGDELSESGRNEIREWREGTNRKLAPELAKAKAERRRKMEKTGCNVEKGKDIIGKLANPY